jgi:FkbM family methyltransferase
VDGDIQYLPHKSCQIPDLARILEGKFGLRGDGTFVEVGAFDGQSCSNTSFLADVGWHGLYVEPVPHFAKACAARHRNNPNVRVANCAVGETEKVIDLHVGSVLTSADPETMRAYQEIDWAKPFHKGQTIQVQQFTLENLLRHARVPRQFELLVVDVEGGEEGVFNSFKLADWRPRMMIVELEDSHPSFQKFPAITARARALRARICAEGYEEIFRDPINTIFWDHAQG